MGDLCYLILIWSSHQHRIHIFENFQLSQGIFVGLYLLVLWIGFFNEPAQDEIALGLVAEAEEEEDDLDQFGGVGEVG